MGNKELKTDKARFQYLLNWSDLPWILLIVSLGGLVLTWFGDKPYLAGGDFGMLVDREDYFLQAFLGWDGGRSTGFPTPRHVATLVPVGLYAWLTEYLGLSLEFFLKSLLSVLFVCSGLSMYYLCLALGIGRPGRFVASLFYMMNPFSLIIIWHIPHGFVQLPYAFAPLILGMYIRGLEGQKSVSVTTAGICLCWFAVTTSAYTFPPAVVMHWMPIVGYFVFYMMENREDHAKRRRALRFTFCLLGIWCLVNCFWIVPLIISLTGELELSRNPSFQPDYTVFKLTSSTLLGAIRFTGYWALHGVYKDDFFYTYHAHFLSPITTLITFLVPILAFYPFLQKGPRDSPRLFLLCLVLAGLFLIKGPNPPLGGILSWVYLAVPAFATAFRNVFYEYGMPTYLAYSALLGLGINCLFEVFGRRWGINVARCFVVALVFLLIGVLGYPFWTGEVVSSGGRNMPPERLGVPQDYNELKSWTASEEEDHRILTLPLSRNYNSFLIWGRDEKTRKILNGYAGGEIDHWFSDKPIIFANTGRSFRIVEIIGAQIESMSDELDVSPFLGFLNNRYILLHNDSNWGLLKGHPWQFRHDLKKIEAFLSTQSGLAYERSFGKLDLYRLDDKYFLPHIYALNDFTLAVGDIYEMKTLLERGALDKSTALVFTDDLQPESLLEELKNRNNNLIFVNASGVDCVVSSTLGTHKGKGFLLNAASNRKVKFKVADAGKYEIWLKNQSGSEIVQVDKTWRYTPPDSKKPSFYEDESDKGIGTQFVPQLNTAWTKLGETVLKSGRHKIQMLGDSGNEYLIAIIPEDTINQNRNELRRIIDLSNVEFYVAVEPYKESSTFDIPSSGDYHVTARIKSVLAPTEECVAGCIDLRLNDEHLLSQDFVDWEVKGVNCEHQSTIHDGTLDVTAEFSKHYKEEHVMVTRTFSGVSLKEKPMFLLNYQLQNPVNQNIKAVFWFRSNDGSYKGTFSVEGELTMKRKGSGGRYFAVDMYRHALNAHNRLPGGLTPYLDRISIYLGRGRGDRTIKGAADLSYRLYSTALSGKLPLGAERRLPFSEGGFITPSPETMPEGFKNLFSPLTLNSSIKYVFYNNGVLCVADSVLGIPDKVADAYLSEKVPFLDLKKYGRFSLLLERPYRKEEYEKVDERLEITLHLDLTGDGKADERVPVKDVAVIGTADEKTMVKLDVYAHANAAFPGKPYYNLVRLEVHWLQKDSPKFTYDVSSTRMYRWKRLEGSECDKKYLREIISIDDRVFAYDDALSVVRVKKHDSLVDFGNVHLEQGKHFLKLGKNICLEFQVAPPAPEMLKSTFQELEFEKVNSTKYRVLVKHATAPFLLVFNESFNRDWEAYIETSGRNASFDGWPVVAGSLMSKGTRHLLDRHLPINGFANGWWIPVGEKLADGYSVKEGSFEIIIEYSPQRTLELVFLLSGISLVGCIVVVIAGRGSPRKLPR